MFTVIERLSLSFLLRSRNPSTLFILEVPPLLFTFGVAIRSTSRFIVVVVVVVVVVVLTIKIWEHGNIGQ